MTTREAYLERLKAQLDEWNTRDFGFQANTLHYQLDYTTEIMNIRIPSKRI